MYWGRYASELKGLMLFSILHISMRNCKSIVAMVFECYFYVYNQLLHCNVRTYVHACITQYGSTVYIGIAMGGLAL